MLATLRAMNACARKCSNAFLVSETTNIESPVRARQALLMLAKAAILRMDPSLGRCVETKRSLPLLQKHFVLPLLIMHNKEQTEQEEKEEDSQTTSTWYWIVCGTS